MIWAAAGPFAMPHLTDELDSNPPKLVHEVRSGSKSEKTRSEHRDHASLLSGRTPCMELRDPALADLSHRLRERGPILLLTGRQLQRGLRSQVISCYPSQYCGGYKLKSGLFLV